MILTILINAFFIIILTFLVQVPIFSWLYKSLVNNVHIDYITTSLWFILFQCLVSITLIISVPYINLKVLFPNSQWYSNNISLIWDISYGVFINLIAVSFLTCVLNKLVFNINKWDNFFVTFVLLLILIMVVPLVFYLYLVF